MNTLKFLPLFLLIFLLCSQTPVSSANQSIVLTDDVQLALGNAFIAEGDYYRAITEYKKLTFLFPESELVPKALYQIGMAYYKGKDYESAVKSFAVVRQTYSPDYFSSAAFHEGLGYEKLGKHDAALQAYERARFFDVNHPDAANAHVGIILNVAEQEDIPQAQSELNGFQASYPEDDRLPAIKNAFNLLDAYESQPRKSPALAGTMSAILPGSGQMYAEHYKDGLMAFLVNGLFIAGTYAAIEDENYALAGIVGGIGAPFYVGNIYGAANATRKWNLSLSRQLRQDLALTLNFQF